MTKRRGLAAAMLAIVIVMAGARFLGRPRATEPVLVIHRLAPDAATTPARPDAEERAMTLASAAMAADERRRVLAAIEFATTRLEARVTPLGADLDDSDPLAQLRSFLVPYVPSFAAARALERGEWANGELEVRVAASCAAARPAPDERCIPLWTGVEPRAEPSEDRRARLLAWAASRSRRLELGTRERALACASLLRGQALRESSPIALVLLDDDLNLRESPDQTEIQASARRLGRALAANQLDAPPELEGFARAPNRDRIAPWLTLSPSQLLLIPRLSALGQEMPLDCAPR